MFQIKKENIIQKILQDIDEMKKKYEKFIVMIFGSTGSGKTDISINIAKSLPCEIISADSRQIYKYMDIGTDKVSRQIREKVQHRQIDIINPDENYTAGVWKQDTQKIIEKILENNRLPIVVGGTIFYLDMMYKNFNIPEIKPDFEFRKKLYNQEKENKGILYEKLKLIDPIEAKKLHSNSLDRIVRILEIYEKTGKIKSDFKEQPVIWPILMIGIYISKDIINFKIDKRVEDMLKKGLIDEVENLLKMGYNENLQSMNGIGYKEVIGYLKGKYNLDKTKELLKIHTHQYAKRQRTWFRKYISDAVNNPKKDVIYRFYEVI